MSSLKEKLSNDVDASVNSHTPKNIIDLDLIVSKWASYMWDATATKADKNFSFENMDMTINWTRLNLVQEDVKFSESPGHSIAGNPKPRTHTLFRTFFTNSTDEKQTFSIKAERVTRQTSTFTFTEGFTREKDAHLTFKIPNDIVEIGGGMRREHTIECGKDRTEEEEVRWGVDSTIEVKAKSKVCASLLMNELELDGQFTVETRLRGRVVVTLSNRLGEPAFFKSFSGDIVEIVEKAVGKNWLPANRLSVFQIVREGERFVKTVVKGQCKFRLGVEQHVTLNEEEQSFNKADKELTF
jgi:hypothetical protein